MSSNKNIKGKYGGNQMNSIKNDLYNIFEENVFN